MSSLLQQLAGGASLSLELSGFIVCLLASVVAALFAEFMYGLFFDNRATGSQIQRSFMLLGPSITFLFICVQLSLPLSLGLLGALSIIRFRTPIKEPEEVGFLMLLIAGSIGIATFNFLFVLLLYAISFVVLAVRRWTPFTQRWLARHEGVLLLNLNDAHYQQHGQALSDKLRGYFSGLKLESVSSVEGTTNLHYVFSGSSAAAWGEVQKEIQQVAPCNKINLFFSRPGAMG
ncbi:MAG: DUF4956 domain-containing protein [Lentisphaerota bacterium]